MRELLVALALCACTAPDEPAAEAERVVLPAADWRGCARVFTPEPGIAALTREAVAQWREATGCDLRVAEGGIPVRYVERVLNDEGEPQCGVTRRLRVDGVIVGAREVEISASIPDRCHDVARNLLHELGHALAPGRGHTSDGLMAPVPNDTDYVDGIAAAFVCAELLQ